MKTTRTATNATHAALSSLLLAASLTVTTQAMADEVTPCAPADAAAPSALTQTVEKVEALNEKLKPAKEIAGYIRSPQGLAVKLVNDHLFKIPSWVGYAIDPVGAIKDRALSEVKSRAKTAAKSAMKPAVSTEPCAALTPVSDELMELNTLKEEAHRA
jgi:hypothetical protein